MSYCISCLCARALTDNNVFPVLHLQFGGVILVEVENVDGFKFTWVAAGSLHSGLQPRPWLTVSLLNAKENYQIDEM